MGVVSAALKNVRCPRTAAVIVAGGSGTRFGGDKLMAELGGTPVLARSLMAFQRSEFISEIVLAVRQDMIEDAGRLCRGYGVTKLAVIVPGGQTRLLSSLAGVMAVSPETELIAIHDGARPLVTEKIIEDAVWGAYRHGAAAAAIPVKDTIKQAEDGLVTKTPDRKSLFAVQTPQCFQADIIRGALSDAAKNTPDITDDCMAVERLGGGVYLTPGSEENLKITTPLDLAVAEAILKRREPSCE